MAELDAELEDALDSAPKTATPPSSRLQRLCRWGAVALPALLAFVLVYSLRGSGPEPDQWRVWWGEGTPVHDASAALGFESTANYLVTRGLRFAGIGLGLDFPLLAFVPWIVLSAALLFALRARFDGRGIHAAWLLVLGLTLFSARFGASLFIFERVRYTLPLLLALLAVALLLRGRRFLPAVLAAWFVCAIAIFTSAAGTLHWLGLMPLLASRAKRFGAGVFATLCLWSVSMQGLVWLCHDLPSAGLWNVAAGSASQAWYSIAMVLSSTVPVFDPSSPGWRNVVAISLLALFVVLAFLQRVRGTRTSLVGLCLAALGLGSCLSLTNSFVPHYLNPVTAKEAAHAGILLPFGIGLALASQVPSWFRKQHLYLAGVVTVLVVQDFGRGLVAMQFEANLMHKSEALLRFADAGSLYREATPLPSVELASDRTSLRAMRALRRLPAIREAGLEHFEVSEDGDLTRHGKLESHVDLRLSGRVSAEALLVCLVRRRGAQAEIVQLAVPQDLGQGPVWRLELRDVAAWRAGDIGECYGFLGGDGRALVRLGGRLRYQDGAFVKEEPR